MSNDIDYAIRFGAKRDSFGWYSTVPIHVNLQKFVTPDFDPKIQDNHRKNIRHPDFFTPLSLDTPECPLCEARMLARTKKDTGEEYYRCINSPDCRGWQIKKPTQKNEGINYVKSILSDEEIIISKLLIKETIVAAKNCFALSWQRFGDSYLEWLSTPKVALKGKKPVDYLTTIKGIQLISELIIRLTEEPDCLLSDVLTALKRRCFPKHLGLECHK